MLSLNKKYSCSALLHPILLFNNYVAKRTKELPPRKSSGSGSLNYVVSCSTPCLRFLVKGCIQPPGLTTKKNFFMLSKQLSRRSRLAAKLLAMFFIAKRLPQPFSQICTLSRNSFPQGQIVESCAGNLVSSMVLNWSQRHCTQSYREIPWWKKGL